MASPERSPYGTGYDTPEFRATPEDHFAEEVRAMSRPADRVTEAAPARVCECGHPESHHEYRGKCFARVLRGARVFQCHCREFAPPVAVAGPASVAPAEPPEEFRELSRNFPDLIERLRLRAMGAKANGQMITMALHDEAAIAIEELCAALSEDRQLRWCLRARFDAALTKEKNRGG